MKNLVTILLSCFVLFGCTGSGYKEFFINSAPEKFSPTTKVDVFDYGSQQCKLGEIYGMFFKDYLILGESRFNGPVENPFDSKGFAMSIGADVLIASSKYTGTRSGTIQMNLPDQQTTYHSGTVYGSGGSGSYSGTSTTYGTQTTQIPYSVDRYDQGAIFLKNVKNIKPLFDKTNVDFPKSGISEYDGIWINETYTIKIYKSDEYIVGINKNLVTNEWGNWEPNQIKFLITKDNFGIYMMGAFHPVPAKFEINNFGYLEISTQCTTLLPMQFKKI